MKFGIAIGVANAVTGTAPAAETTWFTAITEGLSAPFTMKDETAAKDVITKRHAQAVALDYGFLGLVLGGVFTRKRLSNDPLASPIGGFLL